MRTTKPENSPVVRYPAIAAIFGGHRTKPQDLHYQEAEQIGRYLASHGTVLRCGGYAGIMEAAAHGAKLGEGRCEGIGLRGWTAEARSEHVTPDNYTEADDLFDRVGKLTTDAEMIIAFDGGVGTLYELTTAWAAKIMGLSAPGCRIVLIGAGWRAILRALAEHLQVQQSDLDLLEVYAGADEFIEAHETGAPEAFPVAEWNLRAVQWGRRIQERAHWANADDGYARFDVFLADVIENRTTLMLGNSGSSRLLDLACGEGGATLALQSNLPAAGQWTFDGLDFSPAMVDEARSQDVFEELLNDDVRRLDLPAERYDVVFTRGVTLSRLTAEEIVTCATAIWKTLRSEGIFVLDFLNLLTDDPVAASGKTRLRFTDVAKLLRKAGFRVTDAEGLSRRTMNLCAVKQ